MATVLADPEHSLQFEDVISWIPSEGIRPCAIEEGCSAYTFYLPGPSAICVPIFLRRSPDLQGTDLLYHATFGLSSGMSDESMLEYQLEVHFPKNRMEDGHIPGFTCFFFQATYQVDVDLQAKKVNMWVNNYDGLPIGNLLANGKTMSSIPCPPEYLVNGNYWDRWYCENLRLVNEFSKFFVGSGSVVNSSGIHVTMANNTRTIDIPLLRIGGISNDANPFIDITVDGVVISPVEWALSMSVLKYFQAAYPPGITSLPVTYLISSYHFNARQLWQIYVPACLITGYIACIAGHILRKHGSPASNTFSTFLIFTRQNSLRVIADKAPFGPHQLSKEMTDIKLIFGRFDNNAGHIIGFGVLGEDEGTKLCPSSEVGDSDSEITHL
jgi:hypothetical protein